MIKADIIDAVYEKVGLSKKEATFIVDSILDTLREALRQGEVVRIVSFGSFIVKGKKERVGRNPKSGQEIRIPPRKVLTFKPSRNLRDLTNGKLG